MDFQLVADTHTHALASGHAYSTLLENLHAAKAIGLLPFVLHRTRPSHGGRTQALLFS